MVNHPQEWFVNAKKRNLSCAKGFTSDGELLKVELAFFSPNYIFTRSYWWLRFDVPFYQPAFLEFFCGPADQLLLPVWLFIKYIFWLCWQAFLLAWYKPKKVIFYLWYWFPNFGITNSQGCHHFFKHIRFHTRHGCLDFAFPLCQPAIFWKLSPNYLFRIKGNTSDGKSSHVFILWTWKRGMCC